MSSTQDLQWLLTRKNSSFLVKQKGLGRVFSREPLSLDNLHSYKSSYFVNDKAVGIQPAASGKGVSVTTKKSKVAPNKIAGSRSVQTIKTGGPRRAAGSVANIVGKRGYRSDLLKLSVARTSAIYKTQRSGGRKQQLGNRSRHQASRKPVVEKKEE